MLNLLRNKHIQTVVTCVLAIVVIMFVFMPWQIATGIVVIGMVLSLFVTAVFSFFNYLDEKQKQRRG